MSTFILHNNNAEKLFKEKQLIWMEIFLKLSYGIVKTIYIIFDNTCTISMPFFMPMKQG